MQPEDEETQAFWEVWFYMKTSIQFMDILISMLYTLLAFDYLCISVALKGPHHDFSLDQTSLQMIEDLSHDEAEPFWRLVLMKTMVDEA